MVIAISSYTPARDVGYLPEVTHRVSSIVKTCLETLKACLLFPTRYLGSKTWSIPGLVLRTPLILFKRLFVQPTLSLAQELFGSGYRFTFEKELTPDELQPFFAPLCTMAYVNKMHPDFLPSGWKTVSPEALNLSLDSIQAKDTYFSDPSTGFKACIIEKGKEVIVTFGAVEMHELAPEEQPTGLKGKTANVARSLFGGSLKVSHQADALVTQIKRHPHFQKKQITLAGMCFGGPQASYAGLKHCLPTVCANSFPLSAGQQQELGEGRLRNADKYITNISVNGDFLTNSYLFTAADLLLSAIGIKTSGNFGKCYLVPSAYSTRVGTHAYMLGSVLVHLGHNCRTKPSELARPKEL